MADESVRRVVVLTPATKRLTPEALRKPFVLYDTLTCEKSYCSLVQLPNAMDLLGMPSGGGPPGFVYVVTNVEDPLSRPDCTFGVLPGAAVPSSASSSSLGTCVTAGLVISYFGLNPSLLLEVPRAELPKVLEAKGLTPIPLVEYQTPTFLLGKAGG